MNIKIMRAGPMTTIQDEGRFGYMEYGIGQSGVMDQDSYFKANALVGNVEGEAVIEATLLGPAIYFEQDTVIAYMGADMQARIDEMPIMRGKAYLAYAGQTAVFDMAKSGVRAYIAFAGGIDVPEVMGSRSTDVKCRIGGFQGRKLMDGDNIRIHDKDISGLQIKAFARKSIAPSEYSPEIAVRVILGPQDDCFTDKGIQTFLKTEYTVSTESDRMGIRLDGGKIEGKSSMDIVSDGITFGSVQITSSGLPIILMADHQTTGGYAKIATVISTDLPYLAQARPGDKVRFKSVKITEVQKRFFWQRTSI